MNGVLNTGLEFWQIVVFLVIAVLSVIAVRITFKFDINKYIDSKKKAYIPKLQNACVHMTFVSNDETKEYGFQSTMISPPGTLQWQCQRCGVITYQRDGDFERNAEYYLKHTDEFKKKNKLFNKYLKKAGMV
jgi:hypothetical protein